MIELCLWSFSAKKISPKFNDNLCEVSNLVRLQPGRNSTEHDRGLHCRRLDRCWRHCRKRGCPLGCPHQWQPPNPRSLWGTHGGRSREPPGKV